MSSNTTSGACAAISASAAAAGTRPDHLDIGRGPQDELESGTDQCLVVDDDHSNHELTCFAVVSVVPMARRLRPYR
ncbi:hypothetical protein [Nocardia farcinica]|uniref:hypothetical protein n=1 Tax=Nocardia farcinica TaxID=37329 RepID=UPI0010C9EFD6|nr:hypothetical protein [Nocardia farcinica]